jgi:hypothetical protein
MGRETLSDIRKAMEEVRVEGENKLILERERHADELARSEQMLAIERRENARLQATLEIVRAALEQVTR